VSGVVAVEKVGVSRLRGLAQEGGGVQPIEQISVEVPDPLLGVDP
jgi:hypothetical protein